MPRRRTRRWVPLLFASATLAFGLWTFACSGPLVKQYEYEEDIHLSLDGSAIVYVNASVPALVALRGLDLDPRSGSRLDRQTIREIFTSPVPTVPNPMSPMLILSITSSKSGIMDCWFYVFSALIHLPPFQFSTIPLFNPSVKKVS
jgi:preprotein translocase subunit Sec61beta